MKIEHYSDHDVINIHASEPIFGVQLGMVDVRVHSVNDCAGNTCCIHNPSDHHMRDWPLNWREDRHLMERLCQHGVGHPDPDALQRNNTDRNYGIHGCDGCCKSPDGWVLDGELRR